MAGVDQPVDDMIMIELASCDQLGQRERCTVELMIAPTRSRASERGAFVVESGLAVGARRCAAAYPQVRKCPL